MWPVIVVKATLYSVSIEQWLNRQTLWSQFASLSSITFFFHSVEIWPIYFLAFFKKKLYLFFEIYFSSVSLIISFNYSFSLVLFLYHRNCLVIFYGFVFHSQIIARGYFFTYSIYCFPNPFALIILQIFCRSYTFSFTPF